MLPRAPCGCGWHLPPGGAGVDLAMVWQEHCFWSCPVAQQVVRQLRTALPDGGALHRAHVWLAFAPEGVEQEVWRVVVLAAVGAMDAGRRAMFALGREAELARAGAGQGGLRQATLDEMWHLVVRVEQGVAEAPHVAAGRFAAGTFWRRLLDFAQGLGEGLGQWRKGMLPLAEDHPFLGGGQQGQGVAVRLPGEGRRADEEVDAEARGREDG